MNFGILISLGLHATALLGGLILFNGDVKPFEETKIIPIEMVTINELTNIKAAIKPPKPIKKPEPDPEPEVMTLEAPTKNADAEGELRERVEEVIEEPVKVAEVVPDIIEEIIDVPEIPVESEPEEPQEVDLDRLAGLINKVREQAPERNQQITLQSETNAYVFADIAREGVGEGSSMTLSELNALQSAMYKCWSFPAAAPNPAELIVPVNVSLFPDGYVNQVKLGSFREINYSQWREMTLNFRPDV